MPTIAHNLETAQALYRSSMAGALVEVNKQGQIQTASFGTRVRDVVIHLFQGQSARQDFRAAKAQQVAAKFMEMTQASRTNANTTDTINGRNITVGADDPVYVNISARFAQAATYERPVSSKDQGFENATYASNDEADLEVSVSVSTQHAAFENATYVGGGESDYEVPVRAHDNAVYSEIPAAVANMIREYASSDDSTQEILAQARPLVAYKVGDQFVPVGIGHFGQVYRHHLDASAPASAREAVAWVNQQFSKKTCDVQGLSNYDSLTVDRVLAKLGITARFFSTNNEKLERRSVLENIPQALKDRFAEELVQAMADKPVVSGNVEAAESSVLYDRLNSYQSGSVIHRQIARSPELTGDAKELAAILFDDMLARGIQVLDRTDDKLVISDKYIVQLANEAIAKASEKFPAHA